MVRSFLVLVLMGALSVAGSAAPDREAKGRQELAALEQKLHGTWDGKGPCDGGLTVRSDGTYDRTHQGPAGVNSSGTWKVRWDALPPTLVLTCRESDDPARVGKVLEFKLVQLDDEALAIARADDPEGPRPTRFTRARK